VAKAKPAGDLGRLIAVAAVCLAGLIAAPAASASTITVTTSADEFLTAGGTGCSLREAVQTAANNASTLPNGCNRPAGSIDDSIVFSSASIDPVLSLAFEAGTPEDNAEGDIDIEADPATEGSLTITGFGPASTVIDGGIGAGVFFTDRIFDQEVGTLAINDLALTEGDTDGSDTGGGMRATLTAPTSSLLLTAVRMESNTAAGSGGGLMVTGAGPVQILSGDFDDNTTDTDGGGAYLSTTGAKTIDDSTFNGNSAPTPASVAGGLRSSQGLTMTNSFVTDNDLGATADIAKRGGGMIAGGGTIDNTVFSGNSAGGGFGGALEKNLSGTLNITNSQFLMNDFAFAGGALSLFSDTNITNSVISQNTASTNTAVTSAAGGGIHTPGGTITITNSSLTGNSVTDPAATANNLQAGALSAGSNTVRLVGSTVSGNSITGPNQFGAAITNNSAGADLAVVNSTVTGNTTTGQGVIAGFQVNSTLKVVQSTVAGNSFQAGSGSILQPGVGSALTLRGSVVAETGGGCGAGATVASATFNVDSGATCPLGTGSVSNANALLGPLAANGGPTQTMALGAGSPAIDRLPITACLDDLGAPLGTDQRGVARPLPAGGFCDAGAYEVTPAAVIPAKKCKPKKGKKKKKKKKKCKKKRKKKKKK
jgi:fibronectin-binding autotransporter adhesin